MGTELRTMDMALPIGSLEAYLIRINQIPMLTAEEEYNLAVRFRENGDLDAARQLVMSHVRFVVKVARGYLGYGLPLADLVQEGSIGLMKAVKRFDPEMGVRLVSFAVHWIKAEIHEFIIKNWRMVKIVTTKNQRKLFFNLRKMKKRLGWFTKEEVSDVAKTLNVPEKTVLEMEAKLDAYEVAFDADDSDVENTHLAPALYLEDQSANPEMSIIDDRSSLADREHLLAALEKLDERSQNILQKRWLADKKATLHDLAAEFNVSAERIRQLEQLAMKQLRKTLNNYKNS